MPISKEAPRILKSSQNIPSGTKRIDAAPVSFEELFVVRYPRFAKTQFKDSNDWKKFISGMKGRTVWVYWPQKKTAVHILREEEYFELRTARNRNLIIKEEQRAYRDIKVGIAGLSVGSSIASSLSLTGGPKFMKIADFDVLAPSNLNRIRGSIRDLDSRKIDLIAREIWGRDPFAELDLWDRGVTEGNISAFITGRPRLDIFIDEMDNLALKAAARMVARKAKIPVLMATDNGDGIMLDVERFDKEPKRDIFHGLVKGITEEQFRSAKGKEWIAIAKRIIGEKYMPARHRESLGEIGKTLAGVPQLGTDAMLAGSAMSLAVRKIANGVPLPSGRYIIDMEKTFKKSVL